LQNKCEYVHIADDATTKGKSVASRKTQIHLTGGVGVLKKEFGGGKFNFLLGFDIIPEGKAVTEGNASLAALSFDAGVRSNLSRTVCPMKLVSKTTDSAPTAMASSDHVETKKHDIVAGKSPEEMDGLTDLQREVALRPMKKRRCQNHVYSFLCTHFVGQRALTYHDTNGVRQDKDKKEKVCHGRVEYRVQSRFMATHVLSDHFYVQGGRALLQVGNDEWRHLHCIDINIGLKRWAWTKMGVRFNKCDRNPVVPLPRVILPYLLSMQTNPTPSITHHPLLFHYKESKAMEGGRHSVCELGDVKCRQTTVKQGKQSACLGPYLLPALFMYVIYM
jgi:hypothetical protein